MGELREQDRRRDIRAGGESEGVAPRASGGLRRGWEELQDPETEGSPVQFLVGLALFGGGLFLVLQNAVVYSGFSLAAMLGFSPPFGLVMLPFLIGVAALGLDERSALGWALVTAGMGFIILGLLMGLRVIFQPVTLFEGLLMFGMVFGGAGMILRAAARRGHPRHEED